MAGDNRHNIITDYLLRRCLYEELYWCSLVDGTVSHWCIAWDTILCHDWLWFSTTFSHSTKCGQLLLWISSKAMNIKLWCWTGNYQHWTRKPDPLPQQGKGVYKPCPFHIAVCCRRQQARTSFLLLKSCKNTLTILLGERAYFATGISKVHYLKSGCII